MFVPMLVPHSLDYYSYIVSLELGNMNPPNLSPTQVYLVYSESLEYPHVFYYQLVSFRKKAAENLMGIAFGV